VFAGSIELPADEEFPELKLANEGLGRTIGDTGESSIQVTAWDSWFCRRLGLESNSTAGLEPAMLSDRPEAAFNAAKVGTLDPELAFFTSIGRATTLRATIELLLFARLLGT